jgi:glycosyltransferase involved in cell wall biosynthesis
MKNVIHIMNAMEIGGVEVGVLSLLKSKLNTSYRVMTVGGCDLKIYDSLTVDEKSRLYICNGYFKALLLLIKLNPKVVVSSLWRAHFVSLLFKFLKPTTTRVHFLHNTGFAHVIDKVIGRISLFMSNFILCDSVQTQNWLYDLNLDKSSFVVPMNVSFSNVKKQAGFYPVNFVFVGRFCKQKNLIKSLEFIKGLNDIGIIATFDLYGRDDGELQMLNQYVTNNELSNSVTFHNSLLPTSIECEMRQYNYYLQTSLKEGMAISVFQAIKNGLLPIVTAVGEIGKYTVDGFNAFYIDVDNLKSSTEKFKRLVNSKEIEKFNVGSVSNEDNYPVFDKSFFEAVNKIISDK